MTAKDSARQADAALERHIRDLRVNNDCNVPGYSAGEHRERSNRCVANLNFHDCIIKHVSPSKSHCHSPEHASGRNDEPSSKTEGSSDRHSKGEEPCDHSGGKDVSNGGTRARDTPSLSPKEARDQNTTGGDCGTGGLRTEEERKFDFTPTKGSGDGDKHPQSAGWSVLNGESKRENVSKSDEEEMLHLSQSSTPEKPKMEEAGSGVNIISPKLRKRLRNGVVQRPRPFRARRLSKHITDILSGNFSSLEQLHDQQQHTRDLKQVRTGAALLGLGDIGDKESPLPELSKSGEAFQEREIDLAEKDAAVDRDRQNRDAPKKSSSEMSSEPVRDGGITEPCIDTPGSKRSKGEKEQRKNSDGGLRDAADPSVSLMFSSHAIMQEIERPERRKHTTRIREDIAGDHELPMFQEQRYGGPQESEELQQKAGLYDLAKSEDDTAILPGSMKRRDTAEAGIEESPRRSRKRTRRRRRPRSVAKESSSQEPISRTGGGYTISKEGRQAAQQLRQKLLGLSLGRNNNLAVSASTATENDSSSPGECPSGGACMQPESIVDYCEDAERRRTAEKSRNKERNRHSSAHEIVTEDPEISIKPTVNKDVERHLQEVKGNLPPSEMSQRTEREARSSIETVERTCGSPSDICPDKTLSRKNKKRKPKRKRPRALGEVRHQNLATAHGSNMTEFSEASLAEKPQNAEVKNVSVTCKQPQDVKAKDDAEVRDASGSIDGPGRVLKRPRTASGPHTKHEEVAQIKCDENSLTGRSPAHNADKNLSNAREHREFVQTESGNSSPTVFGSGQSGMMEARTQTLNIRSPAPGDGEKPLKELSFKESCLPRPKSATLEEMRNSQRHEAQQKDRQCWGSRSKQPEDISMQDEKVGVLGLSPGDMSHRNRSRTFKRKKRDNQEIIPLLIQFRPLQEQGRMPKLKNGPKSHANPSSVVMGAHKNHAATRSAIGSLPLDVAENNPGQPAITQPGDEDAAGLSASLVRTKRLPNSSIDSDEAEEIPDHGSVSNLAAEAIEDTALQERGRTGSEGKCPLLPIDLEVGPAFERGPGDDARLRLRKEEKCVSETKDLELERVLSAKTSIEQNLDDQLDPSKLKKQSELLTRRPRRSKRNSRVGGAQDKSIKALDELSDDEDPKDKAWVLGTSSGTQQRVRTKRKPKVEPQKTHPMKTRGKGSTSACAPLKVPAIIDLTDLADDDTTVADTRATDDDDEIAESLKELQKLSLEDKTKGIHERPRCKFLTPLSDDESKLATDLTTRTKRETKIVAIAEAGITLRGESFKRLRGTRWLDDEVLNAYVSLINSRNDAIFSEMDEEHRAGIPRTYVFNTYFFTRLCSGSSGFDYPGVKGWTKRAKVDILQRDIILIPINLGNHHWVLSGVDMENKEVTYLDSMHSPDTAGAFSKLKRWVFEELRHKHGEDIALKLDPHSWKQVKNWYRIRRVGVLPARIEPRDSVAGRMSRVPKQQDSGSCGVFTAKIADCLSLGTKVYFTQKHIRLIRQRMALDLFNGYVPL